MVFLKLFLPESIDKGSLF